MARRFTTTAFRVLAVIGMLGVTLMAQPAGPIQERIQGQRIAVPALNERINISPIQEGIGAFNAPPAMSASRIHGIVINEMGLIVPSAGFVVVRSLRDGKVIGQTQVDNLGQFAMPGVEPGLYSAELVNSAGSVMTSSPAFTVGVGEIVQLTPVVSNSSVGGLASLIGNSTAGAVNSAVSAGVLAVETPLPLSP